MTSPLLHALDDLRGRLRSMRSVLVAYSGGVDSALVLAIAHEQLGDRAVGCIGVSPSYPAREQRDAVELARRIGAAVRLVNTHEHADEHYRANDGSRCYYCKIELYDHLRRIAAAEGWHAVANGTHADDVGDHRHGMRAAHEQQVRSPLLDSGLGKSVVRELARHLGLPAWDKPAVACLASRVPRGTPVTPELLRRIERAEDVLAGLGFRQFRVRHHGELARIELPAADLPRAMEYRGQILAGVKDAGYQHVTLDLAGFRPPTAAERVALLVHGEELIGR